MRRVKILDCTLRDGGYINKWRFGKRTIREIARGLVSADIDIMEVGFLTSPPYDPDFSLYATDTDIGNILTCEKGGTRVAAMIAIGEKEMDPALLGPAAQSPLDIVRITFHGDDAEMGKAFSFARTLREKGYDVCMQPVGTIGYTDAELVSLIEKVNELHPYAFYLVDTLGEMYKHDILRLLYLADHNLAPGIAVGLHSHNNLQLSLANAQEMVEFRTPRELILDSSVFGMGRGAGNLHTEAITEYLNTNKGAGYDILPLLQIIDEQLMQIYVESGWGYSAAYFLSAVKHCHPNYATFLMAKQSLRVTDVGAVLDSLPAKKRLTYDKELMEELYEAYQKQTVDDAAALARLKGRLAGVRVLVVAPGLSVETQRETVLAAAEDKDTVVFAVNFIPDFFEPDYIFVSNRKRFSAFDDMPLEKMVFTSNVTERPEAALAVNYVDLLNSTPAVADNAGLMLMKLLAKTGVKAVKLAGFDGFSHKKEQNFYSQSLVGANDMDADEITAKNSGMQLQLEKRAREMDVSFLTASMYF